ncbi:MAG: xanthine dehydrogenase family protein molybdopterin-binding subunit [Variibacter sp.]|nr:xanthine dehydrogenase family protein molybdopterin-binding subunit [Variibacter sp.]
MGEFALGQAVPRFEDPRLIQGGGRYLDDVQLPGMAYAHVLRSPHAHARIVRIDTAAAKAAPGVLAVITGAEWKASGFEDLPKAGGFKRADGSPLYRPAYPAIDAERVRYVGDYVAFVVAETLNQAMDASELIEVDYEPLPAVVETADATKPGAPRVYDDCPDNISFVHRIGNKEATDAAFAKAAHVVKHRFVINRVTAVTMEPRGCVAIYDKTEGSYVVHTAMQRAHVYKQELAQVARVPESKVRVIGGDIGGSFGMKSAVYNEVPLAMLASKLIGRPVKWKSTRSEAFMSDAQARDNVTTAELALDKDLNFIGLRVSPTIAIGAQLQTGMPNVTNNFNSLVGVYRFPASYVDATAVFTHTPPVRPYRGNGRPEAAYVIERLIDIAADELKVDPVSLRRRNLIPRDAFPYQTALLFKFDCGEFEKNMDMALELAEFRDFPKRRAEAKKRGRLRGIGLSNSIERAGTTGFEGAEVRFDRGGTVTLFSGSVNHGQGHETVFTQLVCDRLGLEPKDVTYVQADTDKVFFGEGTGGSRSATMSGAAFHEAIEKVIVKAKRIAAHGLKVAVEDVKFEDGIFSSSKTNQTLTIKDVARDAVTPARLPKDLEGGLAETAVIRGEYENFPNGCHICELEIDPETGTVEIVRYSVVDDVGTVLNSMLLYGQIHGGVVQGIGQVLKEDIRYDTSGQLLTGSFMDYAMPRAHDFCAFDVHSNPVPTKTNPLGTKGAGEAGTVGAMPAVANAVVDALSELGVKHIAMPATPEVIWRAIRRAS